MDDGVTDEPATGDQVEQLAVAHRAILADPARDHQGQWEQFVRSAKFGGSLLISTVVEES
jgi:hypothetical protein